MSERAGDYALVILSPLRGLRRWCESIAGIEYSITKQEIESAMITGRAPLGNDLKPCTAWPRKEDRIRILIDFDFLDRRRRNARTVRLDAIHHQRDAIGSSRVIVQKA